MTEELLITPPPPITEANTVILDIPFSGAKQVAEALGLEHLLVAQRGRDIKKTNREQNIAVFVRNPWERLTVFWDSLKDKQNLSFKKFLELLVFDENPLGFENQKEWAPGPYQFCNHHLPLEQGAKNFANQLGLEIKEDISWLDDAEESWRSYYDEQSFDYVYSIAAGDIFTFALRKYW